MTSIFLKLTDKRGASIVLGDATAKGFEGWITVLAFSIGSSQPHTQVVLGAASLSSAKVNATTLSILKPVGNSSVKLGRMYSYGEDQPCNAMLEVQDLYRYSLTSVSVSDIRYSGTRSSETTAVETVELTCDPMQAPQLLKK